MRTSQNGIKLITSFEGCYTKAYWDKYGRVWTIGYGHTGPDVFEGKIITKVEADELLKKDLIKFEEYVNNKQYVPFQLNQNQFDALVSFTYNCGPGNLKKLVGNRNLSQIANELLAYNKSKGQYLRGLARRRAAERELFLNGNLDNSSAPKKYDHKKDENIYNTPVGEFTLHIDSILDHSHEGSHFLMGDYNHNGCLDLYFIKTSCPEFVEVHILSGADNFKTWLLQIQTPLKEQDSEWDYCLGDFNHDGNLDLFCIKKNKTGTNSTEVHILSGASGFKTFILQTKTNLHETGDNTKFCVGDYNGDGNQDLFYISKRNNGSKKTEIHILSGGSNFQTWLLHTPTILHETDDNWEFGVSNYSGRGNKDLYCIFKKNDQKSCTDVHILNGSTNYQSWDMQTSTKLHQTDENFDFYPVGKQLFVISKKGGSGSTEIHALRI